VSATEVRAPLLYAFMSAFDAADEDARREIASRLRPYLVEPRSHLLNAEQKAQQLGVHPDTLVRMARAGRIPSATKVGREWRFPAGACEVLPMPVSTLPQPTACRANRVAVARNSIAAIRGR
jgi:excisionase family DNA binding protein